MLLIICHFFYTFGVFVVPISIIPDLERGRDHDIYTHTKMLTTETNERILYFYWKTESEGFCVFFTVTLEREMFGMLI